MKKLKGYEIRQLWLDFFKSKGHAVIPSAPLVPHDDPTLLWINAGVAPLKKYFDGREKPTNPRMCNAQKSIRTNDIDNVGRTSRHHTFFEMLGNFSIGDYFRDEVIPWATELLFDEKWFGFPKEKIYITYYPDDTETFNRWVENGVDKTHLIPLPGNFWEIGEGPCGPDTEIFFDRGEKYDPENIGIKMLEEDMDNERYIEIWNIVLSQFNSVTNLSRDEYPELPSKNIDTGSGLERLACIFQETETNYETDLFLPLINFVEEYTKIKYEGENKMAFRVIADHVRSVSFAVADGAIISNEGRGYVLRRILRRAVRYGKRLGINEPFLYKMVSIVVDNMKQFYSYLSEKQSIIEKIIKTEEENFLRTLETGEKKLNDIINANKKKNLDTISGKDAFLLYDTFGFPIELTEEISNEASFKVDIEGFKEELNAQKMRARAARSDMQSMNTQNEAYLNFTKESLFVGYDNLELTAKVIGLFNNNTLVDEATSNIDIESETIILNTPTRQDENGGIPDYIYNFSSILGLEPQEEEPVIAKTENGSFYMFAGNVKPYLFPLSSMTEEQKRKYNSLRSFVPTYHYEYGDIVEDTELTLEDLRRDFPEEVVEVVALLTHEESAEYNNTDYFDYIRKIKAHPTAKKVKLADIAHNSDQSRCTDAGLPEEKLRFWQQKYQKALAILME